MTQVNPPAVLWQAQHRRNRQLRTVLCSRNCRSVLSCIYCAGEKPEEYVRWLCGHGIDYNFGEITESTRLMTEIFKGVYDGAQVTGAAYLHCCTRLWLRHLCMSM